MASILVPILYVITIFGGLWVFSYFYRKRTAATFVEPYFPSHPERDAYVTLLQRTDPPASDIILKAALVRRAMADVNRVLRIREDKPALQNLLQKGSIGDDLWNSLVAAERELETEIVDVIAEANAFVEGWGSVIFQTANEMLANEKMRSAFEHTQEAREKLMHKYNIKPKSAAASTQASTLTPPASVRPASPARTSSARASPARPPSALPNEIKPPNGLNVPASPALASATALSASDSEPPSNPSTPRTPSKSPGKKGKKRK